MLLLNNSNSAYFSTLAPYADPAAAAAAVTHLLQDIGGYDIQKQEIREALELDSWV
jgi:ATP-dependent 26S proteasome regulatory subunit